MAEKDKGPDFAKGIASAELAIGAMMRGTMGEAPVILVRSEAGLRAFSAKCTHLGAMLDTGLLAHGEIRCPWHHARFSADTGEAVAAPAFAPLSCYRVEERDGQIVVGEKTSTQPPQLDRQPPERIVILGAGAAGFACAHELAKRGAGAHVTLIDEERDAPYDRTFCSKQYLAGKKDRPGVAMAEAEFLRQSGVTLRSGEQVLSIDAEAKTLSLKSGTLPYDALVIASGAAPKRADTSGFERENVYVLRSLADADAIIAQAREGRTALIVGSSFIGLEAAASLRARKVEVHVVAPGDIPLRKVLGADVGRMVRALHEENGVRFHQGKVHSYDGRTAVLEDGIRLDVDFVVLGLGVAPRVDLASAAGLELASDEEGGGIRVDSNLRTSASSIFAAGDVANLPARAGQGRQRIEHWVHAQRQGQHVARVLLGHSEPFEDVPFFWSAHFGTSLRYVGHAEEIAEAELDGSTSDKNFALRLTDNRGGQAIVTCKRDKAALEVEADWER
ncbi:FAD-dependent oxidoreductase [Aureimonas sp. N4]|uniref:FAD-dependent oxidoreductase n=1 Tax=Aureimonas sp. N4 TaxID=1638165 RepID=UPI0007863871|nr:FAD-dependent oxidoreductase [Aureimonas sp. N4]